MHNYGKSFSLLSSLLLFSLSLLFLPILTQLQVSQLCSLWEITPKYWLFILADRLERLLGRFICQLLWRASTSTCRPTRRRSSKMPRRQPPHTPTAPRPAFCLLPCSQTGLTPMENSPFEDMRSRRLIQGDSALSRCSPGQYSGLAPPAKVMPAEPFLSVAFYRRLTMPVAIERYTERRSNYSMIAVNPSSTSWASMTKHFNTLSIISLTERNGCSKRCHFYLYWPKIYLWR